MRKIKHWLHILLTILTSGLWLPVYLILVATTEMFNRGYREGKAAGRVQRQNEIDEERARPKFEWAQQPDARTLNCRCVVRPIDPMAAPFADPDKPREFGGIAAVDRFEELHNLPGEYWTDEMETEYQQLRKELNQ